MNRIITMAEIQDVKPLSKQAKESFINQYIEDAQIANLKPLIGRKLYNLIINAPQSYAELLEPFKYDNEEKSHSGLKRVLIEFAWTRYMFQSGDVSTPFGMIQKDFGDGSKIDRNREKELKTERQKIATEYWLEVKEYIFQDEALRDLYQGTDERNITYKSQTIKRNQCL